MHPPVPGKEWSGKQQIFISEIRNHVSAAENVSLVGEDQQPQLAIYLIPPGSKGAGPCLKKLNKYSHDSKILVVSADSPPHNFSKFKILIYRNDEDSRESLRQAIDGAENDLVEEEERERHLQSGEELQAWIEEHIDKYEKMKEDQSMLGCLCYFISVAALLCALAFVWIFASGTSSGTDVPGVLHRGLPFLAALGLIAAIAKLALNLGKAFTSESIKGTERVHRISLGKLYFLVKGQNIEWEELNSLLSFGDIKFGSQFEVKLDAEQVSTSSSKNILESVKTIKQIAMEGK